MEEIDLELYEQNHDAPLSYQYAETANTSSQVPLPLFSCDPFPRALSDSNFVSPDNIFSNNYDIATSFSMSQPSQQLGGWEYPVQPSQFDENLAEGVVYYETPSYITTNDREALLPPRMNYPAVPRGGWGLNPHTPLPQSLPFGQYLSSLYTTDEGIRNGEVDMVSNLDSTPQIAFSTVKSEFKSYDGLPNTSSEVPACFNLPPSMPPSETSDDGLRTRETTTLELEMGDQGCDEPYAKLIYRALMSVPSRSMVLQEIYQWFRANTTRGNSDTKGWMNSIRHNLSMNAAFRKTERTLSNDESKKSTEWVLEDFAIRDGVQSTTRYRKGTANKKPVRSDTSATSRQLSGRKGGMSSSRTARQRHRQEERSDLSRIRKRSQSHLHIRSHAEGLASTSRPSQVAQRQITPLTPPNPEGYQVAPKVEIYNGLPYKTLCGLENVHGVRIDDGPVFSTGDHEFGLFDDHHQHQDAHHHGLPVHDDGY